MYTDVLVAVAAVSSVVIAILLLLMVAIGVNIANKLEDLLNNLRGSTGMTTNESIDDEEENGK